MENNAHSETKEHRLQRFQNSHPYEVIDTLTNSINNYFNNEIALTIKNGNYQSSLLFLGIHAVALTISEGLFGKTGPDGYKLFLEKFVDGDTPDTKFSAIAQSIHDWRNVLAHQWIGSIGHSIGYDYTMPSGFETRDKVLFINPRIYCEHYLKAFGAGGRIYKYEEYLTDDEMEQVKNRLIKKYLEN